ncbi:MAG TPA: class III extradiol ring-cleavage dioxygenase [Rectinemataceae bacterium]|nr:class III extradiol ring-cleavage dioxygenase [Rectinemataceae bacterium]
MARRLPVWYLPHGGGPWNVLSDTGDEVGYKALASWLSKFGAVVEASGATSILVISAHWEEPRPTIHFGERPGMLYDYGGFPEHSYHIKWPAPGDPRLAARVEELLAAAGIKTARELERGYDHGTFVPLMVAFPEPRLPVAQLSLIRGLDPVAHYEVGRALEPLRDEGVLIVGSGMSYHNLRAFFSGDDSVGPISAAFDDWLERSVALADPQERRGALVNWMTAPHALECHPRSEHLLPLHVIAGAAGKDPGQAAYRGMLMGARISAIGFGT